MCTKLNVYAHYIYVPFPGYKNRSCSSQTSLLACINVLQVCAHYSVQARAAAAAARVRTFFTHFLNVYGGMVLGGGMCVDPPRANTVTRGVLSRHGMRRWRWSYLACSNRRR